MKNKISFQDISDLEQRIAAGMTTAADVELMQRIIEQVVFECRGGNHELNPV